MKKLNKVAVLFASAAVLAPMMAFAQGKSVDNWQNPFGLTWKNGSNELLQGALLTARYHYPEIQTIQTLQEIEKIRRNIWLELNNYLTPLEQVNVISSILYNYYKMIGVEIAYNQPEDFFINKTAETKTRRLIMA